MATTKTLRPTNVTISIPEFTDQPDQRVNSNCLDKEADAINALSEQIGNITHGKKDYTHITAQQSVQIQFGKTYSSPPAVVVTFENASGIPGFVWVYEVTTTYANVNVYYSNFSSSFNASLNWIAIGS